MQKHIKEPNNKNKRTRNKKQNNEEYLNYLKSDISDASKNFNSYMSVGAIGIRMAKLQNKLKYTNVLAPSLRDLPDFNPSNLPFTIIKKNHNKGLNNKNNNNNNINNNRDLDCKNKPSTSSSEKNIVFKEKINNPSEIKSSNNENKDSGKKRKGDNLKKKVKKSKKEKDDEISNKLIIEKYKESNMNVENSKLDMGNNISINSLENKPILDQQNSLQSFKSEVNLQNSIDHQIKSSSNKLYVSQNNDKINKEQELYINSSGKESNIKNEMVRDSSIQTNKSKVSQTNNFKNNTNPNSNSINALKPMNNTEVDVVTSNPINNQSTIVNNNTFSYNNSYSTSTKYNNNSLTNIYTEDPKTQYIDNHSSIIQNQNISYKNENENTISKHQPFIQNQNSNKKIPYPSKLLQNELTQQSRMKQSQPEFREQMLQLKQQQQQQQENNKQQINKMLHQSYLYSYNSAAKKCYNYSPVQQQQHHLHHQQHQQQQQQEQKIYYSSKTSSYQMLTNDTTQVSRLNSNDINTTIMNQMSDTNINRNTLNSSKAKFYNPKQYNKSSVASNISSNSQTLSMNLSSSHSANFVPNNNQSLTMNINTSRMNISNNTLTSKLNNQGTLYPTQLIQSPINSMLNTSKYNTTPSLVSNKLLYNNINTIDNSKPTNSMQAIVKYNSDGKIEEIIPTPELPSSKLPALIPTPELVSSRLPKIVLTPELRSTRLQEIIPTPELVSSRLPEIISTPEMSSSRLPELISTPEITASRTQRIVPTPELTSTRLPDCELSSKLTEIIPTPELSSSRFSEELLFSRTNSGLVSQINESISKINPQYAENNIEYNKLVSTTVNNSNHFNSQNLILPEENTRYISPILKTNTLPNIENEKAFQTTFNEHFSGKKLNKEIINRKDSTNVMNNTYNTIVKEKNIPLFQDQMLINNSNSLQKEILEENLNLQLDDEFNTFKGINQRTTSSHYNDINISGNNSNDFINSESKVSPIEERMDSVSFTNDSLFPTPTIYNNKTLPPLYKPINNFNDSKEKRNYLYV
ncbi:hypothetical protein BCR36DRAFT_82912 [Piromyces finnis]|uniref:Uncharacterized protein n=1 Tax=Piromyces finnis TaxID=1754191 RepID=A0A1Y1V695_9FUNG|nr:hypothetical protein BCR36DRAFT_82912 [Piromyces finnis]|eukprot:ORX48140.1 hypothetical protein BCR36DRAFT_82912 [Piromyces finnis]